MKDAELSELLEYFGQEQACYTALLNFSRRQRTVIEAGDMDGLLRILGDKQKILSRVGEIEKLLRPYKENWQAVRARLHEAERQKLGEALRSVEELLAELIRAEKESEELLLLCREAVAKELKQTVQGRTVNTAYGTKAPERSARFLDVRSE